MSPTLLHTGVRVGRQQQKQHFFYCYYITLILPGKLYILQSFTSFLSWFLGIYSRVTTFLNKTAVGKLKSLFSNAQQTAVMPHHVVFIFFTTTVLKPTTLPPKRLLNVLFHRNESQILLMRYVSNRFKTSLISQTKMYQISKALVSFLRILLSHLI